MLCGCLFYKQIESTKEIQIISTFSINDSCDVNSDFDYDFDDYDNDYDDVYDDDYDDDLLLLVPSLQANLHSSAVKKRLRPC